MKTLDEITTEIEGITQEVKDLVATATADDSKTEEVKALVETDLKPKLDALYADRERAIRSEEHKALIDTVGQLAEKVENLSSPNLGFKIAPTGEEGKALVDSDDPYSDGTYSAFVDVRLANKGDPEARSRLSYAAEKLSPKSGLSMTSEGKAMSEGTPSQGGYLVQPELERQLVLAREKDNVIRPLVSAITVNTNAIQLDQLGISTVAGWVNEAATKPETTAMTLASVTANVYTAAGLATVSNQLLADSNPAIDQLLTTDLAKRIVALEEDAFLNGTGSGMPFGILQTSGVTAITYTESSAEDPSKANGLLDQILEGIAVTQTEWGQPSAIVMHPRTWTAIIKSRDSAGHYTIAPRNIFTAGYDPATPRTYVTGPEQTLFGVPVILSNRIPTNAGAGTESRIIIGDFSEALILDRLGLTVDESPHVFFTSNQTVFRVEARLGFTAARSPKAFTVIGGTGLKGR